MLDLVGSLATKDTDIKYLGKSAYFMLFNPSVVFACPLGDGTVYLTPISIRLTFTTRVKSLTQKGLTLQHASLTFSTKNHLQELAGVPVCVYGNDFQIHGRLRRSKFDRSLSQCTFSHYLVLTVSRVVRHAKCKKCQSSESGCCGAPECIALFESKIR